MSLSRRDFLGLGTLGLMAFGLSQQAKAAQSIPDSQYLDLHLLNRISYGARPEDMQRINQIGKEAYLDEQLQPDSLEDTEADHRLRLHPLLTMDRKTIYTLPNPEDRAYRASIEAFLIRAIYGKKQLLERALEFWTDHFNVPFAFDNNVELVLLHRNLRKHSLGKFRDLLMDSATSHAMLVYLDNAYSSKDNPNENYARELLELHTLGVDGGYSEHDVKEIARAFTGWTIHDRTKDGFYFYAENHDTDEKYILGHTLAAGRGIEDGLQVLSILANHPNTARFICSKLCQKFVSDHPPQTLVDQLVQVWQGSQGHIATVLRALFLSEEFQKAIGQKLRRPLDFFVAARRATGTELLDWWQIQENLDLLGQPPYAWEPPNGYPDVAGAWMSTGGLLARWNLASKLTHDASSEPYEGWAYKANLHERLPELNTVAELVQHVSEQVFGAILSDDILAPFIDFSSEGAGPQELALRGRKLASLYSLMLSSPQFQWR